MVLPVGDSARGYRLGRRIFFRVVWAVVGGSIAFGLVFRKRIELFQLLYAPAEGRLSPLESGLPIITGLPDAFFAVVQLAFRAFLLVALPILTIGLLQLFKPWFKPSLYWSLVAFLIVTTALAIAAGFFVYHVMVPVGVTWLLKFTDGIAEPFISLGEYVGLVTTLILGMFIVFELPLVMFMTAKAKILKHRHWKKIRRPVYGTAFIFSALISPGFDLSTASIILGTFAALYEFGLLLAWVAYPDGDDYFWFSKVWARVVWIVRRPVVIYRRVRDTLMTHGLWF